MNLRQLEYFCGTVEAGTITAAAERLFVASTAISMQIAQLETEIGGRLFDRAHRPMTLTPLGTFFYPRAKELISTFQQLERESQEIADGKTGWIGIGFVRSVLFNVLPAAIRTFKEQFPNFQINLVELLTEYQLPQIENGLIHIGLSRFFGPYETVPDFTYTVLFEEPFVAALPNNHQLARQDTLSVTDLNNIPLILYPKDINSMYSRKLLASLRAAGVTPHVAYEAIEIHTALALVDAGLGAAIVGRCVASKEPGNVVFLQIEGFAARTTLVAVTRNDEHSPAVTALLESFHLSAA